MKKLSIIFVFTYFTGILCAEHLMHNVIDEVPAGHYRYYSLMYDGLVKIRLTTQSGDADLYVSQITTKPTYDPDNYCLQSTTCGEDIIYIPNSFKRPVSIGVYGHPSSESSRYILIVYQVTDAKGIYLTDENPPDDNLQGPTHNNNNNKYENQMFLEILQDDGLVIAAKGLGIEVVFLNLLKAYSDPGQLVIVLGTDDFEEAYFIEQLKNQGVKHLPRVITAQCLTDNREVTYLEGGVLFISGRILVHDLLKNRVPLKLVSGILVYRAHSISRSYQEAFALRIYRKTNKTGFVKAFTNSALAFSIGMNQIEQVMKKLFVKKLYLWPRFHKIVNSSLSKVKPQVFELHVKFTLLMNSIQSGLLDVMNYLVQELRKLNKYLDLDELTVENVIANKFHHQLKLQFGPILDQLSEKSQQLVEDLKTLRSLMMCLTHDDSISFYSRLTSLCTKEYAIRSSGWTVLDVVDDMFKNAKSRVFTEKGELDPEPNPKWKALTEILLEIEQDHAKTDQSVPKILILTRDSRTCSQLKNLLTMGAKEYLLYEAMKKLKLDKIQAPKNKKQSSNEIVSETPEEIVEEERDSYVLTLSQKPETLNKSTEENINPSQYFEDCSKLADLDLTALTTSEPILIIESMKRGGDSMSLNKTLEKSLPTYVIMYAADISAVRQLEVYQNKNPSIRLQVYFLIYGGSVEEQAYLTSLRREKEAFDKLVLAKTTMVISAEQDGKCPEPTTSNEIDKEVNTRKGGLEEEKVTDVNKVIVDVREFMSELPSLLHQRDIEIEPTTLIVGDYILSPDICIERKSISDLIQSLNSGRLYNQAVAMTRYYAKPMLLIEFDQNKPFNLQGNYYYSSDKKSSEVTSKLQLLTMHFPRLKLVWSPSPHATSQLFEELKQGRPQPDAIKAAQIGADSDIENENVMAEKYNSHIQDFVSKLPGVHSKNKIQLLNKGVSLEHLITLTKSQLTEVIPNPSDADSLYKALHGKYKPSSEASNSHSIKPGFSKVKSRGLFFKKRGK